MKKFIYRLLAVILGILLGFMVHASIEMAVIELLMRDFSRFGLGLTWAQWYMIHGLWTIITLAGGALFGWWVGGRWWQFVYIKLKRDRPEF